MAGLHNELAALRGEIQALNARISGLDRLLERLSTTLTATKTVCVLCRSPPLPLLAERAWTQGRLQLMPPAKRRSTTLRAAPLLDSLEQRLDLLTRARSAPQI